MSLAQDITSKISSVVTLAIAGLGMLSPSIRYATHRFFVHSDENPRELRWNWSKIDTTKIQFPADFIFGTAVSEYQTSGAHTCRHSNWAHWEKKAALPSSDAACKSWDDYAKDIACLKELGVNAYRFSVDWSKIEPQQGVINEDALAHYEQLCDELIANGIKPIVTLHHFVHPQWFERLGAFEKSKNIKHFVNFCVLVFNRLKDKVALWGTINEPGIYVFQGYVRGCFPPGKTGFSGMRLASKVLKNMLNAHVAVYHAIKNLPGGDKAQIGIVHQYLTFEQFHDGWSPVKALIEYSICSTLTSFIRDTIIEYFNTGTYHFYIPGVVNYKDTKNAYKRIHSLDYIGLNYYSHVFLRVHHRFTDMIHPGYRTYDIPTTMPFAVYAEGLYRAIKHMAQLNVPIYITENGAPTADDACKDIWLRRYLYAVSKAIADGYPVHGYCYWSLLDNYEWDMGYTQKFGLYHVDFKTQQRTLCPGAQWFVDVIKQHKK